MINYIDAFFLLNELMNTQKKKRDEIRSIQEKKLKTLIKYVYENNKFYHDWLSKQNVTPSDIKKVEDIKKIPIIDKKTINENFQDIISKGFEVNKLLKERTSGSSGKPLFLYFNPYEDLVRKAKHIRSNKNIGQRLRDNWVTITSPHHFPKNPSNVQNMLNIYNPRPVSVFSDLGSQVESIKRLEPDILDGYATSVNLLAAHVERNGIDGINPRLIITSAELLTKNDRDAIESVFKVPVYDQYSCVEFGRVSWECTHRNGYHIDTDNLVVEFLDENGDEVDYGESGRIVCTSLFNYSMPLIRYSIGDSGIPDDEVCNCGINLPLMKTVEGRNDSIFVLPNGRKLSPRALSIAMGMFKHYDTFEQFQIIQRRKDLIKMLIKTKNKALDLEDELIAHMSNTLGIADAGVKFEVELVDEVPPSSTGKLSYVISEINKK